MRPPASSGFRGRGRGRGGDFRGGRGGGRGFGGRGFQRDEGPPSEVVDSNNRALAALLQHANVEVGNGSADLNKALVPLLQHGRSIRKLCHYVMTGGQGSAIRSETGMAAKSASAPPPRQIQVAYRAQYLSSNYGYSFSASSFHLSTFSTQRGKQETTRRDLAAQDEDPFDPLTDRIPEKPVTFAEGASYTVAIFAGFAVAAAAAYAVFKELIFEPKEYKVFNKALDRVQNDNQVTVRIGLPVTGYGQDSRNRAARQRIPHRTWADEDGVERIEVQFYVRGPHGVGRVHSEMFKDKEDKQWKFTYLIVDILSPSPTRLMLESYVPT